LSLLYDNSFPRPPEELNAEITDIIIESIPLLSIPVQDGNSQQEEIDIVTSLDDELPPSVENDDDDYDLKPNVIAEEISDKLNEDKCFDPGREINVSTKIEDDDYFPFMFVIRFFLLYFIFPEVSSLLLFAESEDTIFDPSISDYIQWYLIGMELSFAFSFVKAQLRFFCSN
nr:hypothetical protein [Tanacetum cinerariifolium]